MPNPKQVSDPVSSSLGDLRIEPAGAAALGEVLMCNSTLSKFGSVIGCAAAPTIELPEVIGPWCR